MAAAAFPLAALPLVPLLPEALPLVVLPLVALPLEKGVCRGLSVCRHNGKRHQPDGPFHRKLWM